MKALLITGEYSKDGLWTGGDQIIEISDRNNVLEEAFAYLQKKAIPPRTLRYVYFDNVLYECISKTVLADVLTGIEI